MVLWEFQHRYTGFLLWPLAWYTCHTGLEVFRIHEEGGRAMGVFFWVCCASVLSLMVAVWAFSKCRGGSGTAVIE